MVQADALIRKVADENACRAVVFVVRRVYAHAVARQSVFAQGKPTFYRYVLELAPSHVLIRQGRLAVVGDNNIRLAVVVKIRYGHAQ